jgi:hypothetical protein
MGLSARRDSHKESRLFFGRQRRINDVLRGWVLPPLFAMSVRFRGARGVLGSALEVFSSGTERSELRPAWNGASSSVINDGYCLDTDYAVRSALIRITPLGALCPTASHVERTAPDASRIADPSRFGCAGAGTPTTHQRRSHERPSTHPQSWLESSPELTLTNLDHRIRSREA